MPIQKHTNVMELLIDNANNGVVVNQLYLAQGAAVTAAEIPVLTCPSNYSYMTVSQIELTFDTAISGAGTNYQTFTFNIRKVDGSLTSGNTNVAGSYATTASATAFVPLDVTGTGTIILSPGQTLTFKNAKTGSGTTTPNVLISVQYVVEPVLA